MPKWICVIYGRSCIPGTYFGGWDLHELDHTYMLCQVGPADLRDLQMFHSVGSV